MRVGVLARADDRGIGYQTHEFYRHVPGCRALVVREPGTEAVFPPRLDRFAGECVVEWDVAHGHTLPETEVRDWLSTVDVVYSPETLYDRRVVEWARAAGVATVVHVNPELWRGDIEPTVQWLPTRWCVDRFPDAEVVPVPVAPPVPPAPAGRPWDQRARLLHVVGRRAAHDRNGTIGLYRAIRFARGPLDIDVASQDGNVPHGPRIGGVRVTRSGPVDNRWTMYADHGLLVIPRRYGGLCLPVQEAAACGLAIVMTDTEPNGDYPAELAKLLPRPGASVRLPGGRFVPADVDPRVLGDMIRSIIDSDRLETLQERSVRWALDNLWTERLPEYVAALERAADRA